MSEADRTRPGCGDLPGASDCQTMVMVYCWVSAFWVHLKTSDWEGNEEQVAEPSLAKLHVCKPMKKVGTFLQASISLWNSYIFVSRKCWSHNKE